MTFDPRLSGLRGLAALMVAMLHLYDYGVLPAFGQFNAVFGIVTAGFWIGVPVFLMLSMYLLLTSLDNNPNLKHYFWRRIRRIWPMYFGSIILIFIVFQSTYHLALSDYIGFFTFTEYYTHPSIWGPLGVFWTLQLEEAAYVFIPLIHRSRRKEWVAAGLIATSAIWLVLLYNTQILESITGWSVAYLWFSPPSWVIAYGLGILIYARRLEGSVWKLMRWLAPMSLVVAALGLPFQLGPVSQEYEIFYPLGLIAFAAVVANPPSFMRHLRVMGEESYGIYSGHIAFFLLFGVIGFPLIILAAFGIELALRPTEISKRLNLPLSKTREPASTQPDSRSSQPLSE